MRLINTATLRLESFPDSVKPPPYAILSHTWGRDTEELTFQDLEAGKIDPPSARAPRLGTVKLRGTCKLAQKDGLKYAWIDTCCINKKDNVELSTAINSMFQWYQHAVVCYVYLTDVPATDDPKSNTSAFQRSRWFERGWTLQELIAPKRLLFYHSAWGLLGSKVDLKDILPKITGIPREFLLQETALAKASVAQRMAWASRRQTKLPEDLAYCLLGIFGVSIPMVYGEGGPKTFIRLQDQIFRNTHDESILAWGLDKSAAGTPGGALASAPSGFLHSGHVVRSKHISFSSPTPMIIGDNVYIVAPLYTLPSGETYGLLNCQPGPDPSKEGLGQKLVSSFAKEVVGVPLAPVGRAGEPNAPPNSYVRVPGAPARYFPVKVYDTKKPLPEIYIRVSPPVDKTIGKGSAAR